MLAGSASERERGAGQSVAFECALRLEGGGCRNSRGLPASAFLLAAATNGNATATATSVGANSVSTSAPPSVWDGRDVVGDAGAETVLCAKGRE